MGSTSALVSGSRGIDAGATLVCTSAGGVETLVLIHDSVRKGCEGLLSSAQGFNVGDFEDRKQEGWQGGGGGDERRAAWDIWQASAPLDPGHGCRGVDLIGCPAPYVCLTGRFWLHVGATVVLMLDVVPAENLLALEDPNRTRSEARDPAGCPWRYSATVACGLRLWLGFDRF